MWRIDCKKSKSKIVKSQLQYSLRDDSDSDQVIEVGVKKNRQVLGKSLGHWGLPMDKMTMMCVWGGCSWVTEMEEK